MAKLTGVATKLLLKAAEISGDFREVTLGTTAAELDTTTYGQTGRQFIPGYTDGAWSLSGFWESGAGNSTAVLDDLVDDTTPAVATLAPYGLTSGYRAKLLYASAGGVAQAIAEGGATAISAELKGAGGNKYGQLLHVADVAATANGTGYDNPSDGATTKGAAFHLHIPTNTRDAGSIVVSIEDSANNSAFASVSGLSAFTSVAAAATASERITLANGLTLRRYVRAVVTVTAGSTGSYSVRVAYQRNY